MGNPTSSAEQRGVLINVLDRLLFSVRPLVVIFFALGTVFMAYNAWQLEMSAAYEKMLPYEHPYIDTYYEYRDEFGGGDRISVALIRQDGGDIFTPEFFAALRKAHDAIFNLYGVNRATLHSLLAPDTVYFDIVPTGLEGGRVVPADFSPTPAMLEQVRINIQKAGLVGRLVANDLDGAIVSADLSRYSDPTTREPVDYRRVAEELEQLRQELQSENLTIHVTGFAKSSTDIADGATSVALFFFATVLLVIFMLYWYCHSLWVTLSTIIAALMGVVWQLGLLNLFGLGIDPMNVLVPFLVFAVGISHAVQMMNGWSGEITAGTASGGLTSLEAARRSFRRLFVPAILALLANVVGFLTLFMIEIRIIQELALGTMMGMAIIIPTKLALLPVLLSYTPLRNPARFRQRLVQRAERNDWVWHRLSRITLPVPATVATLIAALLFVAGVALHQNMLIGDVNEGVSELRPGSVYNSDVRAITSHFHIGADILTVYAQTLPSGCIEYPVMRAVDDFIARAQTLPGVLSVNALPLMGKNNWVAYNQGNPKWRELPRDSNSLIMLSHNVERTSGLLNADCSIMPIYIYLTDHRAETVATVVGALENHAAEHAVDEVQFKFAAGNAGVVAATNEEVAASELPMLVWLFAVIFLLCLATYRHFRLAFAIVLPLALISMVVNGIMVLMGIGLKVNTLPVAAIGVGIAVDYGIYICHTLAPRLNAGIPFQQAYYETLRLTGKAVIFIAAVLAAGVASWVFSPLQFQADMGLLLTLTFALNGVAVIVVLPAILKLMRVDNVIPVQALPTTADNKKNSRAAEHAAHCVAEGE